MSERNELLVSRRRFLQFTAATAVGACLGGWSLLARAGGLPHLTLADPTAKAMDYVEDSASSKDPLHKAGDVCSSCQFYNGADSGYGTCQLFPGKVVNAQGWCTSYTRKKG